MKHIKLFEELNFTTYKSAADKLRALGHGGRADDILAHAATKTKHIYSDLGAVKFRIIVPEGVKTRSGTENRQPINDIKEYYLKKIEPVWGQFEDGLGYYEADGHKCKTAICSCGKCNMLGLDIVFNFAPIREFNYKYSGYNKNSENKSEISPWMICVPLNMSKMPNFYTVDGFDGNDQFVYFADRQSALKFKRFIASNKELRQEIEDKLCDEHGLELENLHMFYQNWNSISINQLGKGEFILFLLSLFQLINNGLMLQ